MATETTIVAHASYHFEDLQLSSKEFYQSVEAQLQYYEYPHLRVSRISFFERDVFSSIREYLCIRYKEHSFYVCAAPFGRSYFISWWLKERLGFWTILLHHIPFFGARLVRRTVRRTFYHIDTETMFLESIKKIVEALVEKVRREKGFRSAQ